MGYVGDFMLREQEVVGSNPAAPTNNFQYLPKKSNQKKSLSFRFLRVFLNLTPFEGSGKIRGVFFCGFPARCSRACPSLPKVVGLGRNS